MKYLKILIGALIAAIPLLLIQLCLQTRSSEQYLYDSFNSQMEQIAKEASSQLTLDRALLSKTIKLLVTDKDYSNKLKEFYQIANSKNLSSKQQARLPLLQEELPQGLDNLIGPGLDLTIIGANGAILLATEKAPYPVGTDIKHTSLFKNVRSGYALDDVELDFLNRPVALAAIPVAVTGGAMTVLISYPLSQRANALLNNIPNKQLFSWVISVDKTIIEQAGTKKIRKAPAISDKATIYEIASTEANMPMFLKNPEFCGLISVAVPVKGNIPGLSLGFVMDTVSSYEHIDNSQFWSIFGAIMVALLIIIYWVFTTILSEKNMELLCDHMSMIVKGTKTNELSVNAYSHELRRIVVLINKIIALYKEQAAAAAHQRSMTQAQTPIAAPAFPEEVSPLEQLVVPGLTKDNTALTPMSAESSVTGESALDIGLIDQLTGDMQNAQNQVQQSADMPSSSEMVGALHSLDVMGQDNSGISGLFIPEENNRATEELIAPPNVVDERTYSAVPLPPLSALFNEPMNIERVPELPPQPEPVAAPVAAPEPAEIGDNLDMAALEAQAGLLNQQPVQPPHAEVTQMAPLPPAALLELARSGVIAPEPAEDPEEAMFKAVFEDFKRIRSECGESTHDLNFAKFAQKLRDTKAKVLATQNCREVRFSVQNKNGKATLKATAVK